MPDAYAQMVDTFLRVVGLGIIQSVIYAASLYLAGVALYVTIRLLARFGV